MIDDVEVNSKDFFDKLDEAGHEFTQEQRAFMYGMFTMLCVIRGREWLNAEECEMIVDSYNTLIDLTNGESNENNG